MSVCLMSIKPKWARELYSGKKTIEFRKSSPALNSLVFLYESAPVRAVTGVFMVQAVLKSSASHVWYATRALKSVWKSGTVKRDDLFNYAGGATGKCCAIWTNDPWRFPESRWVHPEKFAVRPPQSWQTLRSGLTTENQLACELLKIIKEIVSKEVPHA